MASVNKAILIGNLTKDVEVKYTPSGDAVANLNLATNETWKDKTTGEKKEAVEFHRVTMFGKLAEIAGKYLAKGSPVYLEGKITTRKWTDKNGIERYTTEIRADEMKMLGGRKDNSVQGDTQGHSGDPYPKQDAQPQRSAQGAQRANFDNMDDDIPFAPVGRGIAGHAI